MTGSKATKIWNGRFVPNFKTKKPGRQCVASNEDGNWLVYIDTKDSFFECLLWNPRLKVQIQLPCLPDPPESFYKFFLGCYYTDQHFFVYILYFFYDKHGSYLMYLPGLRDWQFISYTVDPDDDFFCDVAVYEDGRTYCGLLPYGSSWITKLGEELPTIVPTPNMFGYAQRRLVVCYGDDDDEKDRLLLVERRTQCPWEVWELDFSSLTWESVTSLEGLVVFLGPRYSAAYKLRPNSGSVGNCICFTEDGDDAYFYVFSLADQSNSIFRTQPGLIVWSNMTWDIRMPYKMRYANAEPSQKNVTSEEREKNAYEIRPFEPDQECDSHASMHKKLPDDLLRRVAESLGAMDYANYRLVCRDLREIARPIRWKPEFGNAPSAAECPWLMSFRENDSCTSFQDPSCNMRYFKRNPKLSGSKVRYSANGWLLVTRGMCTVFFLEPLSETIISIPDLPADNYVHYMSFSSSPTSSDWIVIGVSTEPDAEIFRLHYITAGDNEWNVLEHQFDEHIAFLVDGCNLVFHNNKFYHLLRSGSMVVVKSDLTITTLENTGLYEPLSDYRKGYLVSCEKDLYLVVMGPLGKFVHLYKFDDSAQNWKKQNALPSNFSFFISQTSSFAVRVAEEAQQNTINFPLLVENRHACYNLDTSEFICYGNNNASMGLHDRKEFVSSTWFLPKVSRTYSN